MNGMCPDSLILTVISSKKSLYEILVCVYMI